VKVRLILAVPDAEGLDLMHTLLASALELNPLDVVVSEVRSPGELMGRVRQNADDVVLLDWQLGESGTPQLVREILNANPRLRVITLLPLSLRQYRREVWSAGACSGIPKEHMDQEWMSCVLCLMHRAIEREAKLISAFA
jgi:DNA-binding NarL/FixJ family response regulator